MKNPSRPIIRWFGGKWMLAPWIISHFPDHRIYVEPFGGAASVLLRKRRSYSEVYNDLDQSVVALFRVLRSDRASDLVAAIELTPFSRKEFEAAYLDGAPNDLELARRLMVRANMGFGSNSANQSSGFRNNANRSGTVPARDWRNLPRQMPAIIERLRGVVIDCAPALSVIKRFDGERTLFYCDPPYLAETRGRGNDYAHEMTDADHSEFLAAVKAAVGMVLISGYSSTLYDEALAGWARHVRKAFADGTRERQEILWVNPAATAAMTQGDLFGAGR
jgi:DNA adenine methylase